MKKVGILTFPNSPSYGASLQMYALYETIRLLGHDPIIINYRNKFMKDRKHIDSKKRNLIKKIILDIVNFIHLKKFRKFEKNMNHDPKKEVDTLDAFFSKNCLDAYVVGSDQVWNPNITNFDVTYFLPFTKNGNLKKISYAASFGIEDIDSDYSLKINPLLSDFDKILVREEAAVNLVHRICNKRSYLVLDPTMLLDHTFWESRTKKVFGLPKKYIAVFVFNQSQTVDKRIDELAKIHGLPVVCIGGVFKHKKGHRIYTGLINQNEWLYVIQNASYVVTDSFHGTVFSIIFNRDFFVSFKTKTNSRLYTLLKTLCIEHRDITKADFFSNINYETVNPRIHELKNISISLLKEAISDYE